MGKMIRMWIGAAVLALMVASCSAMPERPENLTRDDYSSVKEYLALLIKKEMKQQDVTGLSIALVDDQRVIWAEGFRFCRSGQQGAGNTGDHLPSRFDLQAFHRYCGSAVGGAGEA